MRRAIFSTPIILITCFIFQSTAFSVPAEVRGPADIRNSGEIVGIVDFCGPQGTNGSVVDLVGESFSAFLGASGEFNLQYVPEDAYTLRISIPNQTEHTQPVTVVKGLVTDVGTIRRCEDNDDDGFTPDNDCNDNNALIFPGATEFCDGVDNDCDGNVDGDGCEICTDLDNDGFFAQDGCGTTVDCDDSNNTIRPNATEICDGVDNNCDGLIDEGFDFLTDPDNCGECSKVCASLQCSNGICLNECGNGLVEAGEQCDDGSANSDTTPDSCRTTCALPFCGDGVVDTSEQCDDGSANSDTTPDSCRTTCALPFCGDGVTDSGEQCDDGNIIDGDSCQTNCTLPLACGDTPHGGIVTCGSNVGACQEGTRTCNNGMFGPCEGEVLPMTETCNGVDDDCDAETDEEGVCSICGNNEVEFGEQCDDGAESAACDADCTLALCGDGFTNVIALEQCDDGNSDNTDVCTNTCMTAFCGDGFVQTGVEACDDGNNVDGDSCQANCTIPECSTSAECPNPANSSGVCEGGTCGFTCSNGFANCDGQPSTGCEVTLNSNPSCSSVPFLGSVNGDTGANVLSFQNRGEAIFRVRVNENSSSISAHDLGVKITLTVPTGTDYDLTALCDSCTSGSSRSSTNSGSSNEQVVLRWDEATGLFGIPTGSNSGRSIFIKVIFISGNVCDNWTLSVTGNSFSGFSNTCTTK